MSTLKKPRTKYQDKTKPVVASKLVITNLLKVYITEAVINNVFLTYCSPSDLLELFQIDTIEQLIRMAVSIGQTDLLQSIKYIFTKNINQNYS